MSANPSNRSGIMADNRSFGRRFEAYRGSKTMIFWSCAGCVVATLILGFAWGGWMTASSARKAVAQASYDARADMAAAICVQRFGGSPDHVANLAALKGTDSWKRDEYIAKGGWLKIDGLEGEISGAGALCVQRLIEAKPGMTKASG
jgi:hypothetical protein